MTKRTDSQSDFFFLFLIGDIFSLPLNIISGSSRRNNITAAHSVPTYLSKDFFKFIFYFLTFHFVDRWCLSPQLVSLFLAIRCLSHKVITTGEWCFVLIISVITDSVVAYPKVKNDHFNLSTFFPSASQLGPLFARNTELPSCRRPQNVPLPLLFTLIN